jgi:hypothetical protein
MSIPDDSIKSRETTCSSPCSLVFLSSSSLTLYPTGHTAHLVLSPFLLFSFALNVPVLNSSYDQTCLEIQFQRTEIQLQRKTIIFNINSKYQNQKQYSTWWNQLLEILMLGKTFATKPQSSSYQHLDAYQGKAWELTILRRQEPL